MASPVSTVRLSVSSRVGVSQETVRSPSGRCDNASMDERACPCGLGDDYDSCCGRLHAGAPAPTAESLMRSRYSAFAVGDAGYLLRTWHPSGRPQALTLDPALTVDPARGT